MIPIGLNPTTINVTSHWWLVAARDAEAAGFKGVWSWDHFVSRGHKADPVLECWTTLTAAAAVTSRLHVGSFVNNVMNRHPAVLARMVATLWDQSGGSGRAGHRCRWQWPASCRHTAWPCPSPRSASRSWRRPWRCCACCWPGGPAGYEGRFFQLHEAYAHPAPEPPPRIIVGGEKPAGARLAARVGDGWTTNGPDYERLLPLHLEELAAHGRSRAQVTHLVAVSLDKDVPLDRQPLIADMATFLGEWRERGADELIVSWVKPADLPALLEAGARAGLAPQAG